MPRSPSIRCSQAWTQAASRPGSSCTSACAASHSPRRPCHTARNAGADFILGGHPHILEPFQRYPENEPGLGVWFSHGNFLHGQYDERTKYGGIGEYTITRRTDGSLSVDRIRFMPTYTVGMPQTPEYKVIPLADAGSLGWVDVNKSRADITALLLAEQDAVAGRLKLIQAQGRLALAYARLQRAVGGASAANFLSTTRPSNAE